jgi:uncharacterized protein
MSSLPITVAGLFIHPIKSCARIEVDRARLIGTGLEWDREWMVVDAGGEFVSQREEPRLALVRPTLRTNDLMLRAPGMLALHLSLDAVDAPCSVRVWNDRVQAWDMGGLAAQWFSDFLGRCVRLARFDPEVRRAVDPAWAQPTDAVTAFADAFPLLVLSFASLAELNRRLEQHGGHAVGSERFRPNLLIDGVDAHGEDLLERIEFDGADGRVVLRLVKPCTRCSIPDVDPARGERDAAVGAVLASYRANERMQGQVTFGVNAVIESGVDAELAVGATGSATIRFD